MATVVFVILMQSRSNLENVVEQLTMRTLSYNV